MNNKTLITFFLFLSVNESLFAKNENNFIAEKQLFSRYEWELSHVEKNVNLQKNNRYTLQNQNKTFLLFTSEPISDHLIKKIIPFKDIFDDFSYLSSSSISFFINPNGVTATYIPKEWNYSDISLKQYAHRGLVFIQKPDGIYYSFRIMNNQGISAIVYGKYSSEKELNENVLNIVKNKFQVQPSEAPIENNNSSIKTISSSIKAWVGAGSLFSIAYEQVLYKSLVLTGFFSFNKNVDNIINFNPSIESGTSIAFGFHLQYYFTNRSNIIPFLYLGDEQVIQIAGGSSSNNLLLLGCGILLSQWVFIQTTYSLNIQTGENNTSFGMGLRIPF